jgi:hypothetical protein
MLQKLCAAEAIRRKSYAPRKGMRREEVCDAEGMRRERSEEETEKNRSGHML